MPRLHVASTVLMLQVPFSCCRYRSLFASTFSLTCKYRAQPVNKQITVPFSLHRTSNASYSLSKASRECTSILKRFNALFLPLCTLIQCLVLAMPPQSLKIDHLPSDASAILGERYLAGTFSVVPQCNMENIFLGEFAFDLFISDVKLQLYRKLKNFEK